MNKELIKKAKEIFKKSDVDKLYVNTKNHFFTSENYAYNSEKSKDDITIIFRNDLKSNKTEEKGEHKHSPKSVISDLIVVAADNSEIRFVKLEETNYKVGDKAKIGRKNADGIIKIDPQSSLKFEKGVLKEIIKSK